jgi:hypothetical protein
MFLFELKAGRPRRSWGRQIGEPISQPQGKKSGGIANYRHAGFPFFDLQQRHAADGRSCAAISAGMRRRCSSLMSLPSLRKERVMVSGTLDGIFSYA